MLTRWRVAALVAIGIVLASAQVGAHQNRVRLPLSSNTCRDGSPERIWVVNGADATDCSTGGSTFEVECCCIDGTWDQCPGGTSSGSSDSFKTHATPSGTSPVADSATDTLNWTAGTGITITGDSATDTITIASTAGAITLDLGDDGGNDSTALVEVAPINDNGGAFSEPSADKLQIDVAKLRPPSFDHPRETPDGYDCEFSGSICGWTWSADGPSSPTAPVSGTVNPVASVSGDPIYDLTTWPGHMLVQSDESSQNALRLKQSITLDTNATIVAKVSAPNPTTNAAAEGSVYLYLTNAADANEIVTTSLNNVSGGGLLCRGSMYNNGGAGSHLDMGNYAESAFTPTIVLWIFKTADVYRFGCSFDDAHVPLIHGTSFTKTGVTTLDELQIMVQTANETPSLIWSVDWVRYYDSNTLAILNE